MGFENLRSAIDGAEDVSPMDPPEDYGDPGDPGGDDVPPLDAYEEDPPESRAASFPLNDYGNGQRLVEYFGRDFLFVPRLGYFRWDGRRWAADDDEILVRRDAQAVAARILQEVPFCALEDWQREALELWRECKAEWRELDEIDAKQKNDEQKERYKKLCGIRAEGLQAQDALNKKKASHRKHANSSGNTSRISNMLAEAKTAVARRVDELNADKWSLNCENGVLRFAMVPDGLAASFGQTKLVPHVELVPHERQHMITKLVRAEYDAAATCPLWLKFLERILPNPEIRGFLKRWFGYCLTGVTTEHKLAFFYGGGRNGKSTAVDLIARILDDYSSTIPIETLTGSEQRKGSDATPDLVRLPGARFVRASEPEQGQKMKEALIKALTGGEPIMIRRMMQEFVEVTPEFKLTISGNYKPEVRGADDGIWSRILLVPFDQQIPKDEIDRQLPEKLWSERAGVLAWLVEGLLEYMANGLQVPAEILAATDEYRQDSDPLRVFLTSPEFCDITGNPDHFTKSRDLTDAFLAYLIEAGTSPWGRRTVSNQLKTRSANIKTEEGAMFTFAKRSDTGYRGIKLGPKALELRKEYEDKLGRLS